VKASIDRYGDSSRAVHRTILCGFRKLMQRVDLRATSPFFRIKIQHTIRPLHEFTRSVTHRCDTILSQHSGFDAFSSTYGNSGSSLHSDQFPTAVTSLLPGARRNVGSGGIGRNRSHVFLCRAPHRPHAASCSATLSAEPARNPGQKVIGPGCRSEQPRRLGATFGRPPAIPARCGSRFLLLRPGSPP
jgi:hypothetical protein